MELYNIVVQDNLGKNISLTEFKGKVLLIVNTATGCGFTPQYNGLQELYSKYNKDGLEILDFPCNQFANQASGSDSEINTFCSINYNTKFRRFKKIDVNGIDEDSLYTFLKSKKGGIFGKNIKWNFTKFLVDKNGNVISRFAPNVEPKKIEEDIKKLLKE